MYKIKNFAETQDALESSPDEIVFSEKYHRSLKFGPYSAELITWDKRYFSYVNLRYKIYCNIRNLIHKIYILPKIFSLHQNDRAMVQRFCSDKSHDEFPTDAL